MVKITLFLLISFNTFASSSTILGIINDPNWKQTESNLDTVISTKVLASENISADVINAKNEAVSLKFQKSNCERIGGSFDLITLVCTPLELVKDKNEWFKTGSSNGTITNKNDHMYYNDTDSGYLQGNYMLNVIPGKSYNLSIDIAGITGSGFSVSVGDGHRAISATIGFMSLGPDPDIWASSSTTTDGTISYTFTATSNLARIQVAEGNTGSNQHKAEFRNFSVKVIP